MVALYTVNLEPKNLKDRIWFATIIIFSVANQVLVPEKAKP